MMGNNPQMMELMNLLSRPDGVKQLMLTPMFETEDGGAYSQADMLCDVVNSLRMDAKMAGRLHGVEVEIQRCTPETMAQHLDDMVKGNPGGIVALFNDLEDLHHQVFAEVMDDDEFEQYVEMKEAALFTEQRVQQTKGNVEDAQRDALEDVVDDTEALGEEIEEGFEE